MAKTRPGVASSAKSKLSKKDIDSYTIKGTTKIVRGELRLDFYKLISIRKGKISVLLYKLIFFWMLDVDSMKLCYVIA